MKRLVILLTAVIIAGCGAVTPIPDGNTPEAKVYRRICSGCHSLPHPKRNTCEGWGHYLALMDRQMEHRNVPPMTTDERGAILDYLRRHSR